jgi:GGDEF domain-containing protein
MSEQQKPLEYTPENIDTGTPLLIKEEWKAHLAEQIEKGNKHCGVISIDLGNFKGVNDIYGHEYGDHVLEVTESVLAKTVRQNNEESEEQRAKDVFAHERLISSDAASRYGGDEYVVFCDLNSLKEEEVDTEGIDDQERLGIIIDRIRAEFDEVIAKDERLQKVGFSVSIGGAVYEPGMNATDMLQEADEKMMLDKDKHREALWGNLTLEEKAALINPAVRLGLEKLGIRPPIIPKGF